MLNSGQWAKELSLIASVLSKALLDKHIKWGAEVFTFNGKNVVSYGGVKNCFAIWFYKGVFLKDKYNVLVNAQEEKKAYVVVFRINTEPVGR